MALHFEFDGIQVQGSPYFFVNNLVGMQPIFGDIDNGDDRLELVFGDKGGYVWYLSLGNTQIKEIRDGVLGRI